MAPDKKSEPGSDKSKATPMGQYYLIEKIAQGGMAEIFKGLSYDLHGIKKTVVIKKILPHIAASKEFIDSLINEAKIAVTLSHGNIAQTYDLGKVGDDYFMVMEYVEGRSLSLIHKRSLANGKLVPIPILCHFMCEVLSGIDYMHRRTDEHGHPLNIVHRDISPQNLIVTYSGTVKIIDFGIAKAAFKINTTDSGILKGKFSYMSPEQARGDSIDHRSDIFSLGIIFHEMLTGKRLFKADDNRETLRNVRRAKIESPSAFRGDVPDELNRIVMKALAKDRRHRYAFASDMRDDLLKFLSATHPDFKSSDAGAFVADLFRDEIAKSASEEDELKTPQMIIDQTFSALADESQFEDTGRAKITPDMKEFFLEEEAVPETTEAETPQKAPPELAVVEEIAEEKAPGFNWQVWLKKRASIVLSLISIVMVIILLVYSRGQKISAPVETTKAELMVTTDPPDTRLSIDGHFIGQNSPITIPDLDVDREHEIVAERDGYTPQKLKMRLQSGEFRTIEITLAKAVVTKCTLIISSTPPGATVFIDDSETQYRTPTTVTDIAIGKRHSLGLFLEGYKFWGREIEAHAGETLHFDVDLVRNFGALSIDSSPSGALVMLNGTPAGQTPFNLENIEPQKVYRIEVWIEGYEPHSEEIQIEAGMKKGLHVTLKKAPVIPPPESPPKAQPGIQPSTQ
jgi:serine/threonine protein kinase